MPTAHTMLQLLLTDPQGSRWPKQLGTCHPHGEACGSQLWRGPATASTWVITQQTQAFSTPLPLQQARTNLGTSSGPTRTAKRPDFTPAPGRRPAGLGSSTMTAQPLAGLWNRPGHGRVLGHWQVRGRALREPVTDQHLAEPGAHVGGSRPSAQGRGDTHPHAADPGWAPPAASAQA